MSWVPGAAGSGYGAGHLPYGVVDLGGTPRPAVRIGEYALDLAAAERAGLVAAGGRFASASNLDPFLAAGPAMWRAVRERVTGLVSDPAARDRVSGLLRPLAGARTVLPFTVADFVDFYSSEHHARNAARILRPDQPALPPQWRHLPIGYHGRAGSVVVSGTPVRRPRGQLRVGGGGAAAHPEFAPTRKLDLEAEVGFVVGVPSGPGESVGTGDFAAHVFGVVLVDDWSARDVQAWEYRPLGPFLGKSFATSVAAWVTPLAALERAWVPLPEQSPPVLEYLREAPHRGLDLALAVLCNGTVVSRPPFASTYWSPPQQLAHLTSNGAALRTGDLFASGTVSGPEPEQAGSLLELSRDGAVPVRLEDGSVRGYLADGDTVTVEATAPGPDGERLTLAEVTGTVTPA